MILLNTFSFAQNFCSKIKSAEYKLPESFKTAANNSRSDTINILNYTLNLTIIDFTNKKISGNTVIKFTPKINGVDKINLDLLKLTVDSIKQNNTLLSYSFNDTLLSVSLLSALNNTDTSEVTVYYQGTPKADASWGGFYFQSGYAYNLGVGFDAEPHNFGRVWFPCFDNFVERSTYEFNIKTNAGKIAYCNGTLTSDTTDASSNRYRKWLMNKEIPTYLACVAVSNYTQVNQTFNGINGTTPIVLAALASDTTNVKNSFVNLKNALSIYEDRYGPYLWDKVGYAMVPFAAGAMEHATLIAYPRTFADGTLSYQDIMAHELSHHWFGDLATCETAGDMWLNEGMATYSEYVFIEGMNGNNAYKSAIRTLHEDLIHYTHIRNGGYLPISPVSSANTYDSDLVYGKGADVAHSLRGYMGDTAFFDGLKYHLTNNQYKDVNSYKFRDNLAASSGQNLTDFFNDWVFKPGWANFSVDSFTVIPNASNYDVTVYIKQKLDGATSYYNNVPLEITFKDAAWNEVTKKMIVSGNTSSAMFTIPISPIMAMLNKEEKISDASLYASKTLKTTGNHFNLNMYERMRLTVKTISDSAFIRITHNYGAPDAMKDVSKNYRLSNYRSWKVDGILPFNFDATAVMYFDGRNITSGGGGNLDNDLFTISTDSIILLYRKNAGYDWTEFPQYKRTKTGTGNSKYGYMTLDTLMLGEYTFANGVSTVLVNTNEIEKQNKFSIYPNPSNNQLTIEGELLLASQIIVTDINGKEIKREQIKRANRKHNISTQNLSNGIYFITIQTENNSVTEKVVVNH